MREDILEHAPVVKFISEESKSTGAQRSIPTMQTVPAKDVERLPTEANQDAMRDAVAKTPEVYQPVDAKVTPAIFTAGELLPWKGRWLRLVRCDGDQIIFQLVKPTERAVKLAQRRERWEKQHPKHNQGATRLVGGLLRISPALQQAQA